MTRPDQLELLERLITERNNTRGKGGAAAIAREFGVSDSMVSAIRSGDYTGDTGGFLERVEQRYGSRTVHCPVSQEEIPLGRCADNRKRPLIATSPYHVKLWQACRQCEKEGKK